MLDMTSIDLSLSEVIVVSEVVDNGYGFTYGVLMLF